MVDIVLVMSSVSLRSAAQHRAIAIILAFAAALTLATASLVESPADAALANGTFDPTVGPFGPITVIGDSVLQGSVIYSPTLSDQLVARGWGPVRVRAGVGYSTGYFSASAEAKATYWINLWRGIGWDPSDVMVNLGANDSGRCDTDLTCARNAITHLVDSIGPGHRIWWPLVTRHPAFRHQQDNWNLALAQIAEERENFFIWDWPAVMEADGYESWDSTHLSVSGYRQRSDRMAHEITADLAFGTKTGVDAPLPAPSGEPSELVPIGPVRIIDTRIDPPGHRPADSAIVIDVSDHVPEGTTAIAAYVSATNTGASGFLTAYECSTVRPLASTANYLAHETRGAVAITPVSAEGTFCLYTLADADLLVDLQAAFVPIGSGGTRFTPLETPSRLVDTRETGRQQLIDVAVPGDAEVVAVSITAVRGEAAGFLTAFPCTEDLPTIATVNHLAGELIAGAAFVPVSPQGTICVYSLADVDVIIDLTGVFSSDGDLVFEPVTPTRTIDTRTGIGGWSPIHGQFQTIDARVAPPAARAVSGTLTIVAPMRVGFLRAWACGVSNETSNVNSLPGRVLANSVTTGIDDDGRLCVFARAATATVFDTSGWWVLAP